MLVKWHGQSKSKTINLHFDCLRLSLKYILISQLKRLTTSCIICWKNVVQLIWFNQQAVKWNYNRKLLRFELTSIWKCTDRFWNLIIILKLQLFLYSTSTLELVNFVPFFSLHRNNKEVKIKRGEKAIIFIYVSTRTIALWWQLWLIIFSFFFAFICVLLLKHVDTWFIIIHIVISQDEKLLIKLTTWFNIIFSFFY